MDEIVANLPDYRAKPSGVRAHLCNMPEGGQLSPAVQAYRAKLAAKAEYRRKYRAEGRDKALNAIKAKAARA
jgi:hypothetical protein